MSDGIRSGVNWIRRNSRPSARLRARTSSVLAVPGTPSSSTCPRASSAASASRMAASWPSTTPPSCATSGAGSPRARLRRRRAAPVRWSLRLQILPQRLHGVGGLQPLVGVRRPAGHGGERVERGPAARRADRGAERRRARRRVRPASARPRPREPPPEPPDQETDRHVMPPRRRERGGERAHVLQRRAAAAFDHPTAPGRTAPRRRAARARRRRRAARPPTPRASAAPVDRRAAERARRIVAVVVLVHDHALVPGHHQPERERPRRVSRSARLENRASSATRVIAPVVGVRRAGPRPAAGRPEQRVHPPPGAVHVTGAPSSAVPEESTRHGRCCGSTAWTQPETPRLAVPWWPPERSRPAAAHPSRDSGSPPRHRPASRRSRRSPAIVRPSPALRIAARADEDGERAPVGAAESSAAAGRRKRSTRRRGARASRRTPRAPAGPDRKVERRLSASVSAPPAEADQTSADGEREHERAPSASSVRGCMPGTGTGLAPAPVVVGGARPPAEDVAVERLHQRAQALPILGREPGRAGYSGGRLAGVVAQQPLPSSVSASPRRRAAAPPRFGPPPRRDPPPGIPRGIAPLAREAPSDSRSSGAAAPRTVRQTTQAPCASTRINAIRSAKTNSRNAAGFPPERFQPVDQPVPPLAHDAERRRPLRPAIRPPANTLSSAARSASGRARPDGADLPSPITPTGAWTPAAPGRSLPSGPADRSR